MKCDHCPVRDGVCRGESPGKSHLCAMAATGNPLSIRMIVESSAIAAGIPDRPRDLSRIVEVTLSPVDLLLMPAESDEERSRRSELMTQVLRCPHRSRDSGCGCTGHRCGLGKGRDGIVSTYDCLACVEANGGVAP